MHRLPVFGLLAAALVLNGCASHGPRGASLRDCALAAASAGVVAGAATGAIYDEDHDDSSDAVAVGAGVAVGTALIGVGACWLLAPERMRDDEDLPESCDPCAEGRGPRLVRAADPVALPLAEAPAAAPAPAPTPVAPVQSPCEAPITLLGVHFDTDRHAIRPDAAAILERLVEPMQACASRRFRIEAHTDSRGSDAYNQALSERRADSVLRYLSDLGIARDRLESVGWGETRPAAANDTRDGRARNRRVELHPVE